MNDPKLAAERYRTVVELREEGVPRDEAWSEVQERKNGKFEGHLLKSTIEFVYDNEG